jgi:hypothetical protein
MVLARIVTLGELICDAPCRLADGDIAIVPKMLANANVLSVQPQDGIARRAV